MRNLKLFVLISLIAFSVNSYGQEFLFGLQSLPVNEKKIKKVSSQQKSKAVKTLPFFDDFSRDLSYPDPNNWTDSYVIVNQTYAINPPTIGVATFDAINQKGELYDHISSSSLIADTLTSKPISLSYSVADNIYFSFQYQPKGLGEAPDINDSLVVEFYSVDDSKWIRVWSVSANFTTNTVKEKHHLSNETKKQNATSITSSFFNVMIPIEEPRFLKNGFRFRFMNYASLPLNTQIPSVRGNGDHWHIDLVYIDKDRQYDVTTIDDVGFNKPLKSLLKNYESIPWKHFTAEAVKSELTVPINFAFQFNNLSSTVWNITQLVKLFDLSKSKPDSSLAENSDNISPLSKYDFNLKYEYDFTSNWEDSAKYILLSSLAPRVGGASNSSIFSYNDTVKYTQKFFNYYSYDDGSAENSYGLYGEGSQNGMVAVKYHSYVSDSLKGIMMYLCRTHQDANRLYNPQQIPFKLTVWSDANGKPGSILYQKVGLLPIYTDKLNRFTLYAIDGKLKIGGDFWIGWVNTTTDKLNVGFDLNNIHNDKLYYNLSGEWVKSQFEGSLMIRPVFGKLTQYPTNIETPTKQINFTIYPNPTSNQISLNIEEDAKPEMIRIINLAGQTVLSKVYESNRIDVSNLPTGIYLFQLTFQNRYSTTKKLVIIK